MIDNKIVYKIIGKLHKSFSASISICDIGGRVIVSIDSLCMSEINLLAIEALNTNSKVTVSMDSRIQKAGVTMPLRFQESRMGVVVLQGASSSSSQLVELLSKTIELLYEELVLSKKKQNRIQERDQFFYEWLHLQSNYTESFMKRGEHLDIDITGDYIIILTEHKQDDFFMSTSIIQNPLDDRDILLSLFQSQDPAALKGGEHFEKKYNRVIAAGHNCHTGIRSDSAHLHAVYQAALENSKPGKMLFPDEYLHCFEEMRLAIVLSKTSIPGPEDSLFLLVAKGRNAQLADMVITYVQLNGDIQKICDKFHTHHNSIPYRIRRTHEICGRNLMDYYDMLCLYASFVRCAGKEADIQ